MIAELLAALSFRPDPVHLPRFAHQATRSSVLRTFPFVVHTVPIRNSNATDLSGDVQKDQRHRTSDIRKLHLHHPYGTGRTRTYRPLRADWLATSLVHPYPRFQSNSAPSSRTACVVSSIGSPVHDTPALQVAPPRIERGLTGSEPVALPLC